MVCGSGFVNTNSARISSNQNDLEFWCKAPGEPNALKFASLGRPTPEGYKSKIANLGGRLFEYESGRVYSPKSRRWTPYSGDKLIGGAGRIIRIQHSGDHQYALVNNWKRYPGFAVLSNAGYHGSLPGRYSSAFFYRDRIYINLDYKIVSYPIGTAGNDTCRTRQDMTIHDASRNWVYTMFPYNGALYVGGSSGEPGRSCAAIYKIDDNGTMEIPIKGCIVRRRIGTTITEIYAQTVYRDGLLIGVFPHGNLARVSDGAAVLTNGPIDKHTSERYFEPQSLTVAAGDLFVGMYPWGLLFRLPHNSEEWQSQRLFPGPPLFADGRSPYHRQMSAKLHALPFMELVTPSPSKHDSFIATNGLNERHNGLFPTAWGQRITSLAVFNGRLCAGTGNMSGSPWNAEYHDMVPKELADRYGQVLCAEIPNHTAGAPKWNRSTRFSFRITDRRLVVQQDGTEIAAHPHTLSKKQIAALTNEGTLEFGRGVYGPFRGSLAPDNAKR